MNRRISAIVIGASMGGMDALKLILNAMPAELSATIIIVQHQLANSNDFLITYLNKHCSLHVKYPISCEMALPGTVYVAPPGYHLLVEEDHTLSLSIDSPVNHSIPSIDVLFQTAALAYEEHLMGVVLTGASADGAKGLKAIKDSGGLTIVQDPESAESDIMPRAAISASQIDHIASLSDIAEIIRNACNE